MLWPLFIVGFKGIIVAENTNVDVVAVIVAVLAFTVFVPSLTTT